MLTQQLFTLNVTDRSRTCFLQNQFCSQLTFSRRKCCSNKEKKITLPFEGDEVTAPAPNIWDRISTRTLAETVSNSPGEKSSRHRTEHKEKWKKKMQLDLWIPIMEVKYYIVCGHARFYLKYLLEKKKITSFTNGYVVFCGASLFKRRKLL